MMSKKKITTIGNYNPQKIEPKWQDYWEKNKTFESPKKPKKTKKYILDMFPYPSSEGLHVGHPEGYTATDILSRYYRMNGYDILHPMGWDAFGLPAENYAIKTGTHPRLITEKNIENFKRQIKSLGFSYDWSRELSTTDPEYYKWTQWIFLKLYEKGLAYQDEVPINWCPSCKTGLANEEVVGGVCERCNTKIERKKLRQWMLKITEYADRLLEDLEGLDWPKGIIRLQEDWIGKKNGVNLSFEVVGSEEKVDIFTTRIDTIFGATFIVLAPENELIDKIVSPEQAEAVKLYLNQVLNKADLERKQTNNPKTGVFTGAYAVNPLTSEEIPIWVADYVLGNVGTGSIMAVPAHDERDYAFATAHSLEIRPVVIPKNLKNDLHKIDPENLELPFMELGVLIDSGGFTGAESKEVQKDILDYLQRNGEAEKVTTYKLRDWVFSRQRYWGEPIPIIHCDQCGIVPVKEEDLPIELPDVKKYEPTGTGESPLAGIDSWVNTSCPKCGGKAKRETNTMPQWAGSCWYYLRFIDPNNNNKFLDENLEKEWMPVDIYVGGAEHAVLHLLYSRFWHKVLYDGGFVSTSEPFKSLRNQGMILGPDGQKMSKSRGNVINPDEIVDEYGADTLRVYEMFMGPFEDAKPWDTSSMIGIHRFLNRVWKLYSEAIKKDQRRQATKKVEEETQVVINKVTADIENLKFNTAIASLMEFSRFLNDNLENVSKKTLKTFLILLSPLAPHISEELWQSLGSRKSIQYSSWPEVKETKESEKINLAIQVNGKLREVVKVGRGIKEDEAKKIALSKPGVKKFVDGQSIQKVIFIPNKIINFVVKK